MKRWFFYTLIGLFFILGIFAGITIYVDPLFHFHSPQSFLEYPIQDFQQRYICDGMARNFDYDALISGTSMTENFKTSEVDELFGVHSLKISVSGASLKEVDMTLRQALNSNNKVKLVIRAVDLNSFPHNEDIIEDIGQLFLLNNNPFDDVQYLFNKGIFVKYVMATVGYTRSGGVTPSRDEMFNWMRYSKFGKDVVLNSYSHGEKLPDKEFTMEEQQIVNDNLSRNIIETVYENSDVEFYLFLPPYSICEWEYKNNEDGIEYWLDVQKYAIEQLLECDNVRLYAFDDEYEVVCDLDNYKDRGHYGEWVNSYILKCIKNGQHQLTKDNYQDYMDRITEFYTTYDYDSLRD